MAEKYYRKIEEVHLSSNKYVFVLPGWYPTWQDLFLGDFNQRHVKAAGLKMPQVVLYIVKDQSNTLTAVETRYTQVTESIVEITVMYPQKKNKWVDAIYSNLIYVQLLFKHSAMVRKQWGKPLLIHTYIVIRGGVGGLLLGKRWGLPFILSENWTVYYPSDPHYLANRNFLFKRVVRNVFKQVKTFLPVTNNLSLQVEKLLGPVPSTIVPNVVDTDIFSLGENIIETLPFRFIHVSTMSYQKNPEGLLRSFKKFNQLFPECCLLMIGPYSETVLNYARAIELNEVVHFTGSVSYEKVAEYLKASAALVLFSRYENLPCVILEALCCGLPVISTSVGGIPEVIDVANGVLISSENEEELTKAFLHVYKRYQDYNRRRISAAATRLYSYPAVGNLINEVYRSVSSF